MATEIAIFTLKEGKIPDDLSGKQGQVFKDTLDKVLEQPGAQRAYYGNVVEDPSTYRLFVDWDSYDAHMKFTKSDIYESFVEKLGTIVDLDRLQMFHANLKPHPPSAVLGKSSSPATEILLMYFPTDYSKANQDKFDADLEKLFTAVEKYSDKYTGSAGGWVIEELTIPDTDEKAKVYSAFIGWKSVQDHLDFRSTDAFKENIHYLRGAKDLKKLTVVHYHGNEVK